MRRDCIEPPYPFTKLWGFFVWFRELTVKWDTLTLPCCLTATFAAILLSVLLSSQEGQINQKQENSISIKTVFLLTRNHLSAVPPFFHTSPCTISESSGPVSKFLEAHRPNTEPAKAENHVHTLIPKVSSELNCWTVGGNRSTQ